MPSRGFHANATSAKFNSTRRRATCLIIFRIGINYMLNIGHGETSKHTADKVIEVCLSFEKFIFYDVSKVKNNNKKNKC